MSHHGNTYPLPDTPHELEAQFLLRLPPTHAEILHEVLATGGSSMKDRLKLRIENDMRHGTFYLDNTALPGKIVDLPCIIESHKTIDRKNIYKTADICQMMVCTETEEPEEESKPVKKKDGVPKVDKKYLFPHGVTPPLKNVRKRRFRRTLKKKQYTDQPEIEKEVRRLLRQDYEAHHVSWEVVDEEDDKTREGGGKDILMQGSKTNEDPTPTSSSRKPFDVEHIFGEALSDSDLDEESEMMGGGEDDESRSRLSMDDDDSHSQSHQSDSIASHSQETSASKKSASYATSFTGEMFSGGSGPSGAGISVNNTRRNSPEKSPRPTKRRSSGFTSLTREELLDQRSALRIQLTEINTRMQIQQAELSTMDNMALRQRLEAGIEKLASEQMDKEREIEEVNHHLERFNSD